MLAKSTVDRFVTLTGPAVLRINFRITPGVAPYHPDVQLLVDFSVSSNYRLLMSFGSALTGVADPRNLPYP